MKRTLLLFAGLLLLIALEILKVYFIMPFPGSQRGNTLAFSYFLHRNTWWLRIIGILLLVRPFIYTITKDKTWKKFVLAVLVPLYAVILFMFNFRLLADKIFHQPKQKVF